MTKKKPIKKQGKRPNGRPSKYKEEYAEQAYKLCLLGLTDAKLAEFFNVPESRINDWKKRFPKFRESIHAGKIPADAEVAASLYHRAKGYSHPDEKIFLHEGEVIRVPTTTHYPPSEKAADRWLMNRQRALWNAAQNMEISGKDGDSIKFDDVSASAKIAAIMAAAKARKDNAGTS
jgi:hypothetical protein